MKKWRLVGGSPKPLRQKPPVALFELLRPLRLVHVQRLGVAWFANIVKFEIRKRLNPHRSGRVRVQTR